MFLSILVEMGRESKGLTREPLRLDPHIGVEQGTIDFDDYLQLESAKAKAKAFQNKTWGFEITWELL
jgi:hypothetical protein